MKQFFFLFAMLANITASATVTITPLSVNYNTQQVTFKVEWTGTPVNNCVWVWVDLCPVVGSTAGTFQQAVISAASATIGSIATVSGNQRGFYVTTNPSTVIATLSNASGKFNWCAYGSDYPPNATSYNAGTYTLRGSPPFIITGNGTIQDGNKYVGTVINSLTDATGYPGGVWRDQPNNGGTCAPSLTSVGGYCRDLVADEAFVVTNYEVKYATWGGPSVNNDGCPAGWTAASIYTISQWITNGYIPFATYHSSTIDNNGYRPSYCIISCASHWRFESHIVACPDIWNQWSPYANHTIAICDDLSSYYYDRTVCHR
jgi:hypothetical protein